MADAFPGRPDGTNPLSRHPLNESFEYLDPKIESPTDGMYDSTRPMNTRLRKLYTVTYDFLPQVDIDLIVAHYESVRTSTSFVWIDYNGASHTVTYVEPLKVGFVVNGYQSIEPLQFKEV